MSVIREVLSDLLLPDSIDWQRDRVVFNRRRHDRQGLGQGWLILAALLLLAGWLVIGAMLPDPKATLYKYEAPPRPETAEIARLRDTLAMARRSGDESSAARTSRTVLSKQIHRLERDLGKDFTR